MTTTIGVRRRVIMPTDLAMASAMPRSSAAAPGKAPCTSTKVRTGMPNRSASSMIRIPLRYPSGCGRPKLRRMFSSVSWPFWKPITTMRRPPLLASPATMAESSPKSRSPCSSMNSSDMPLTSSSVCGRFKFRACWTWAQTTAVGLSAWSSAAWPRPRSRSTTGCLSSRPSGLTVVRIAVGVAAQRPGQGGEDRARTEAWNCGRFLGVGVERGNQEPEKRDDLVAKLGAVNDPIHEPVAEPELRALVAGRQLFADGARGNAITGETDERIRLGEVDVTDDRERGEDAAGRGIGHDRDEWDPGGPDQLDDAHRLDELHQGVRALLHAGAAGGGDDDQWYALGERGLSGPSDFLTDDRAH